MPRIDTDIIIGRIVSSFGIRGEVKVVVITDFPERFQIGGEMTLVLQDGTRRHVRVERSCSHKGGLNVKFEGVDTRNDADELRLAEIVIDESEISELSEGEFYLFDIIGLKVVTNDGRELGVVTEVLQGGANDVYVTDGGLCIPAIKDIVLNIDTKNGQMVIYPMPGLIAEK